MYFVVYILGQLKTEIKETIFIDLLKSYYEMIK